MKSLSAIPPANSASPARCLSDQRCVKGNHTIKHFPIRITYQTD